MLISDILLLKFGDSIIREGEPKTVRSVSVIPVFRDSTDDKGKPIVLDLSYLEFLYTGSSGDAALYAGPPVQPNLDLLEFKRQFVKVKGVGPLPEGEALTLDEFLDI